MNEYAEETIAVVSRIPHGRVLTYGDVARHIGWGAARSVGAALSRYGSSVTWWRVVRSDGTLAELLLRSARSHWEAEGIPLRPDYRGVALEVARWTDYEEEAACRSSSKD